MKETPEERYARAMAKYGKTLPRIFGDPLRQRIETPDSRLANESLWHISLFALGFLQELAARVKQICEEPRETPERRQEACQHLVNVGTEAAADIHQLLLQFAEPFRAIAETRPNFPCLFPAHPEDGKSLSKILLEHLGLGKSTAFKLRSETGRKTFSKKSYVNSLLLHYIGEIRQTRIKLLSMRFNDPYDTESYHCSR